MDVGESVRTREGRCVCVGGVSHVQGNRMGPQYKAGKGGPWTEGRHGAEAEARPSVSQRGGPKGSDLKGQELPAPMMPGSLLLI